MSVGKGASRPSSWPPVSSIVGIPGNVDEFYLVHLTRAVLLRWTGRRYERVDTVRVSEIATAPFEIFRRGRSDYSEAWCQELDWMASAR